MDRFARPVLQHASVELLAPPVVSLPPARLRLPVLLTSLVNPEIPCQPKIRALTSFVGVVECVAGEQALQLPVELQVGTT